MKYEQLSEDAKKRAMQHTRDLEQQDWSGEYYLEYIGNVLKMLGFNVNVRKVKTYNGKQYEESDFNWSLGYCQGDGFRFAGYWDATDVDAARMMADCPVNPKLHAIAGQIMALVIKRPQGRFTIIVESRSGSSLPYCYAENIENVEDDEPYYLPPDEIIEANAIYDALCAWAYNELREGYESDMEDEQIQAAIDANEWEFVESGEALA